jgi:hypothetical protein
LCWATDVAVAFRSILRTDRGSTDEWSQTQPVAKIAITGTKNKFLIILTFHLGLLDNSKNVPFEPKGCNGGIWGIGEVIVERIPLNDFAL